MTYETLEEVPIQIRDYYEEDIRNEPTGEMVEDTHTYEDANGIEQTGTRLVPEYVNNTYIVEKPRGEMGGNVDLTLELFKPLSVVEAHLAIENNTQSWNFHDEWVLWETKELDPTAEKYFFEDGGGELTTDTALFNDDYARWESEEPIKPDDRVLTDYIKYDKYLKMAGVEFEGVMCSATGDDFQGLGVSLAWLQVPGNQTNWKFDNGNRLILGSHNVDDFYNVWLPFRMSFF